MNKKYINKLKNLNIFSLIWLGSLIISILLTFIQPAKYFYVFLLAFIAILYICVIQKQNKKIIYLLISLIYFQWGYLMFSNYDYIWILKIITLIASPILMIGLITYFFIKIFKQYGMTYLIVGILSLIVISTMILVFLENLLLFLIILLPFVILFTPIFFYINIIFIIISILTSIIGSILVKSLTIRIINIITIFGVIILCGLAIFQELQFAKFKKTLQIIPYTNGYENASYDKFGQWSGEWKTGNELLAWDEWTHERSDQSGLDWDYDNIHIQNVPKQIVFISPEEVKRSLKRVKDNSLCSFFINLSNEKFMICEQQYYLHPEFQQSKQHKSGIFAYKINNNSIEEIILVHNPISIWLRNITLFNSVTN